MAALCEYDYPGNVRELQNILERIFVLSHGPRIELKDLPDEILSHKPHALKAEAALQARRRPSERALLTSSSAIQGPRSSDDPVARRLLDALAANAWDRTRTAQSLGIGRNTLWRRMKEHGLSPSRERPVVRGTRIA
jgi:transcriptional regulator of acetoin/glycerol metabolism